MKPMRGRVEAVLIAKNFGTIVSVETEKIQVISGQGVRGDNHFGERLVDAREDDLLKFGIPKGTEIANYRQFSAVSLEELAEIARLMELPTEIPLGLLGENIILSGIPYLTHLPIGTKLFFQKNEKVKRTSVLVVWGENTPCQLPGDTIQQHFSDIPELSHRFQKTAYKKRGIVGSIYCSGFIRKGDTVIAHIPHQEGYNAGR